MKKNRVELFKTYHTPVEIEKELIEIFGINGPRKIIDIGACDCITSIQYAKLFPNTFITAVEALKSNCSEGIENIKEFNFQNQIDVLNYALGDRFRIDTLIYESCGVPPDKSKDSWNMSSSLLEPKEHLKEHPWCEFKKNRVDMTTLDLLIEEPFMLGPWEFIHIDVQGAELKVFKGGENALKCAIAVWCEVANVELYSGQPMKSDLEKFMIERGFYVKKDTCNSKKYGDCLFVKEGR